MLLDINEAVKRAKNGDINAFEIIVKTYEKKIYNLALRYNNNREDAFDISQEVFIKVFRSIGSFKEESSFSTWLYRVAVNVCIDYQRKNKKHSNSLSLTIRDDDGDEQQLEIEDISYSPETVYDRTELRESIGKALNMLSEEHKQVLILREINGLSYEEIAEVLSLEEGTVKSRIYRGREKLCRILSSEGNIFSFASSKGSERRAGKHD
ncbi:MAG: sigma-70 family RNA polymerase sigma factor [Clostridiales bacterium]|nr:sigma-70 family RNA polymerase sigma factor [Clostridiales bacterium]